MLIICNKYGQLANRLIQFSHIIANAHENNYQIINIAFEEYADYFLHTSDFFFPRYPPLKSQWKNIFPRFIKKNIYLIFDLIFQFSCNLGFKKSKYHEIISLTDGSEYDLDNQYFQKILKNKMVFLIIKGWRFYDYGYLECNKIKIKNYFGLNLKYQKIHAQFIQKCRFDNKLLIGVHIRRKDYKEFRNGKYYYDDDVYIEKMHSIINLFPNQKIRFLICSDESVNKEKFAGFCVTFGLNHELIDLYSFASCDYLIGPPSTYTIWASFYGNVPLCTISNHDKQISRQDFRIVNSL